MDAQPPSALEQAEAAHRRRRRWIWGCGGGCLTCIVLAVAVLVAGRAFLRAAMPLPPAATFMDEEALGVLVARVEPDDELMLAVPAQLATDPVVRARLLTPERAARPADPAAVRENVRSVAPVELVVTLRASSEPGRWRAGAVLSVTHYARMLGMVLSGMLQLAAGDDAAPEAYQGATIWARPGRPVLGIWRNVFMLSASGERLKAWVEALAETHGPDAPAPAAQPVPLPLHPALRSALARLQRSASVRFACRNENGLLATALEYVPDPELRRLLKQTRAASKGLRTVAGQLTAADGFSGDLTLYMACTDPATAAGLRAALVRARSLPGLEDLRADPVRDATVRATCHIDDVPRAIVDLLVRLERGPAVPRTHIAATRPSPSR